MSLDEIASLASIITLLGGFGIQIKLAYKADKKADIAAVTAAQTRVVIDEVASKTDGRLTQVVDEAGGLKAELAAIRDQLSAEKAAAAQAAVEAAEKKGKAQAKAEWDAAIAAAEQRGREAAERGHP